MWSELALIRTNPGSFVSRRGYKGGIKSTFVWQKYYVTFFFDENMSFTSRWVWYPREPPPGYKRSQIRVYQDELLSHRFLSKNIEKQKVIVIQVSIENVFLSLLWIWKIFEDYWRFPADFLWSPMTLRVYPKRIGYNKRPRKWRDLGEYMLLTLFYFSWKPKTLKLQPSSIK